MNVDGSATLRRTDFATSDFSEARAFMDATYGGYLKIGDWRDTTPMLQLRRIRLEHAHRELQSAAPSDGATVLEVARRWGFANPSRFAAYYRDTYGQPPSRTLRP